MKSTRADRKKQIIVKSYNGKRQVNNNSFLRVHTMTGSAVVERKKMIKRFKDRNE